MTDGDEADEGRDCLDSTALGMCSINIVQCGEQSVPRKNLIEILTHDKCHYPPIIYYV